MKNDVNELLTAVGALAETCGYFKSQLLNNGFSEKEALVLVSRYLAETINPTKYKEDN